MSDLQLWFPEDFDKRYAEYRKKLGDVDDTSESFLIDRMVAEKENVLSIKNEIEYQEEIEKWKPLKIVVDEIHKELSPFDNKPQSLGINLARLNLSKNVASNILMMLANEKVCRWKITQSPFEEPMMEYLSGEGIIVSNYEKFKIFRKEVHSFYDFIEESRDKKFPKNKVSNTHIQSLQNKTISLKDSPVTFIDNEAKLKVNDMECEMPPYKSEHYLCRVMFDSKHSTKEAVDWSQVFEEMEQLPYKPTGRDTKKDMKSVQDTMYALNKRVRDAFHTKDDLFSWKNKCVVRNF